MGEPASDRWPPGAVIVQEEFWQKQLVTVRSVTVVEDSVTLLALFSHAGSRCLSGAMVGRQQMSIAERLNVYLSEEQPVLAARPVRANVLTLNPPGATHSIALFWDADWSPIGWYVNLQAPLRRASHGIAVSDYLLDLTVTPDLAWRWKDEDEFEAVCLARLYGHTDRGAPMARVACGRRGPPMPACARQMRRRSDVPGSAPTSA